MTTKWLTPIVLAAMSVLISVQDARPQSKQGQTQSATQALQTNTTTSNNLTPSSPKNEAIQQRPTLLSYDNETNEKLVSQWNEALAQTKDQAKAGNEEFNLFIRFNQYYIDSERCTLFQLVNSGKINEKNITPYINDKKIKLQALYTKFVQIEKDYPTSVEQAKALKPITLDTCFPSCTNIDFNTGDFTGWSGFYGINNSVTNYNITNVVGGLLGPVVRGALDPFSGNTDQVHITSKGNFDWFLRNYHGINMSQASPWGGNFSAMIGDSINNGAGVAILSQKFFVSPGTTNFTYQYAVFLENPNHPTFEQPFFKVAILDQNGDTIPFCGQYVVVSKATIPGFKGEYYPPRNDTIYWKDWTQVNVPLSRYVGQCITVVFEVADCEPTGHCGYAYVDASCSPLAISMPSPMLCGSNSGTLDGPAGAARYLWSGPAGGIVSNDTLQNITVDSTGTYTLVITPVTGAECRDTLTIHVVRDPGVKVTATSLNVPCNGNTNGSITVNAIGGSGAYTYLWTPSGGTNATATGLSAGKYIVLVTDSFGCSITDTITLTQPALLMVTAATLTNISCNGANNGSAKVTVAGGLNPYTYLWNPSGQTNAIATGLSAGSYTVNVTDANGCTGTANITITQPPVLTATASSVNITCNGNGSGNFSVLATGGTPGYKYLWAPCGCTESIVWGPTAGSYSVVVTDSNGCTATATTTVTQPLVLTATTYVLTNVNCNGGINGSANVTAAGGTTTYTYLWSPSGQTNSSATGLSAGNYTVTVTDANGCLATANANITQPSVLSAIASISNHVSCAAGNNGSAKVTISGGTSPYTYLWNPTGQTNATATGLSVGSYTVTVTDANGCTSTSSITITEPLALTANTSAMSNVSCTGGNNGSANVTAGGGTSPYTYLWKPYSQTNSIATGLSAGTYTVTVTDANNCTATAIAIITQPLTLIAAAATATNVSCNGGSNATASATATGGTNPYTYLWNPSSQTNSTATGLSAGSYKVTVTDANGCISTATTTVTQPLLLVASATSGTNVSCNGGANGMATGSGTGGTGTYTYLWNPTSQTNSTATGLSAGTYTVTITDANGCSATAQTTITQPLVLTAAAATSANVSCNGGNNGSGNVNAIGGTNPYTYLWNPTGQTNSTATRLTAGTYSVIVTDANGCIATATIAITQPAPLTVTATTATNVNCNGGNNGSITAAPIGGTAAYTYSWNPSSQTNSTATGLTAGIYTVTVTDSHGCTATTTATITQPLVLTAATATSANVSCNAGNNGSTNVIATGGTAPYNYLWTPSGQTNANATGLTAGNYTVTITDANGCTASSTSTVTQPLALSSTTAITNVSCNAGNNGSITTTISGGTGPYAYIWNPSGQTTALASGLSAGNYTVTVSDANGCSLTATASITQATTLNATLVSNNVTCHNASNGNSTITVFGGTMPYQYLWTPTGQTNANATGLTAGNYTVTVTDSHGCSTSATTTLTQPLVLMASPTVTANVNCNGNNNGIADVTVTGGTGPYNYLWNPSGQTNSTATGLSAGNYTVAVTDTNGCTDISSVTITEPTRLSMTAKSSAQSVCSGQSVTIDANANGGTAPYTYKWSCGGTTSSLIVNPLVTSTYSVIITDANGCTIRGTVTIGVNTPLTATSDPNKPICPGQSATLEVFPVGGDGMYSYNWMPGGSTSQLITITPSATTTYTVIIKDGCSSQPDTMYETVVVAPLPDVKFSSDLTQGCSTLCIQFRNPSTISSGNITQWAWNFGDGDTTLSSTPVHCYTTPGKYTVTLTATSNSGCSAALTKISYISVFGHPSAAFVASPQPTTILNPLVQFTDQSSDKDGIISWGWIFGETGDSNASYIRNPFHHYRDTGVYKATLVVMNVHGCVDSASQDVVIEPDFTLYFPNAFSPNGDGLNEIFAPKGSYVKNFEMYIYDRWGMKLFHTNEIDKGWDGRPEGANTICQEDTYVYIATAEDERGNRHQYIGNINLIK